MIDIDRFICSLIEHQMDGSIYKNQLLDSLKQQGIIYKDGSLIRIDSKKCGGKLGEMVDEMKKEQIRLTAGNMSRIITVTEDHYGICELDVDRVIALVPRKLRLLFEDTYWNLNKEDFDRVSEVWHKLKDREI